ncbi:MAG: hypothetical protein GF347_04355 [Candidatus Moranbacteria bacterium]|nr:hypothetical protein [Candidatus Moranbacteria bacterium]
MQNKKGKLIAFYGINNLGRSTQAELLVKKLSDKGYQAESIKFPVYGLEPTGSLIMNFLRDQDKYNLSNREFQLLNFINQNQKTIELEKKLDQGIFIVCESYFGSAAAWGIAMGVEPEIMEHLYQSSRNEDLAVFFDGEMFERSPQEHSKLDRDNELLKRAQETHKQLALKYDWYIINANQAIDEVKNEIWEIIKKRFF